MHILYQPAPLILYSGGCILFKPDKKQPRSVSHEYYNKVTVG